MTEPEVVAVAEPEHRSEAMTPGSVKAVPHSTVMGLSPFRKMSGAVVSVTVTVR